MVKEGYAFFVQKLSTATRAEKNIFLYNGIGSVVFWYFMRGKINTGQQRSRMQAVYNTGKESGNGPDDFPAVFMMTLVVEQVTMVPLFRNRNKINYYRRKDNEDFKTCNELYLGGGNDSFTMPCF